MKKISQRKRAIHPNFHLNKVFIELEGGSIFTLKDVFLGEKGIYIKRKIKEISKIPIGRQRLFAGKYEIKDTTRLLMYPISEETILKVFLLETRSLI
jgi:hypothetical protein